VRTEVKLKKSTVLIVNTNTVLIAEKDDQMIDLSFDKKMLTKMLMLLIIER
jgi:hypothetical protein